ncbi:leucine-rich repeat-containing protein 20 isoform X3 [Notamacropus eugenii]|uniref:leucine-rich repeat-containing protein 20 isoform X3 n=2 Tax=Notamacropus eugenii TaxID=9315 RepID=UPI003B672286
MGGRADSRNSRTPACTPVAPEITLTSWPGSERPCPPSSFDGWRNRDLSKVTQCVQPWDPGKDCVCMLKKMGEAVARVARKVNETVENELDTLDLAECKLVSFPVGIYKVLRNVTGRIHLIILANNELQSLTSKFMTTFSQLQELRLEGNSLHRLPDEVSTLQHLKAIDLSRNHFQDFPEKLTALQALETINLEENAIVDVPVEKLAAMPSLKCVNLRLNPLNAEVLPL